MIFQKTMRGLPEMAGLFYIALCGIMSEISFAAAESSLKLWAIRLISYLHGISGVPVQIEDKLKIKIAK